MGINVDGNHPEGSVWTSRYSSSGVDTPEMPLPEVHFVNMRKLIILHITLISTAAIVLCYEIFREKWLPKQTSNLDSFEISHVDKRVKRRTDPNVKVTKVEVLERKRRIGMTK